MRRTTLSALTVAAVLATTTAPAFAAAPANDDFASAVALGGLPAHANGTVDEATRQADEPAHGVQTVWYAFRPTRSERVAAELDDANFSSALAVHTGPSLAQLDTVAASRTDNVPRAVFQATAGQTYWIAVAAQYATQGTRFELRVRPAPLPANDGFEDAQSVTVPGIYDGSLADATGELGEPVLHGGNLHSIWYRFKPARTGRLTIEAAGQSSPVVGIYTGSDVTALRKIAVSPRGVIRFVARANRTYRVAVSSPWPGFGDISLTVSDGSVAGKGLTAAPLAGQSVESVRSRGLRLTVGARRKVDIGLALVVPRATAKALGLDSTVLGRAAGELGYFDFKPAAIKLTRAARRALDGETELKASVRVTILHSSAPNRVLTVPVVLPN